MADGAARLADMFAAVRGEGRAALLPYLTAGLPDPTASVELFVRMAEAGADGFEIGVPYSDPLMDGPIIHEAGLRSLAAGTTPAVAFDIVRSVVATTGVPCLVMTYVNPVLQAGIAEFCAAAVDAGASGLIIADLPVDEAAPFRVAAAASGLGLVLFVAPTTTPERLRMVIEAEPSFIYGVADLGVTGDRGSDGLPSRDVVRRVRRETDIPLVLGVGISTPSQVAAAAAEADGVIVGSALVRRVVDANTVRDASDQLAAAVEAYAAAVRPKE